MRLGRVMERGVLWNEFLYLGEVTGFGSLAGGEEFEGLLRKGG